VTKRLIFAVLDVQLRRL